MKKNTLYLPKDVNLQKLHIKIKGKNNTIKIAEGLAIKNVLGIEGYLDNSVIEIGENFTCGSVYFQLGQDHKNFGKIRNVSIKIGDNTSWEGGRLVLFNSNSYVEIGKECMFASNVTIFNTDAHPIFKEGTAEIINRIKGVEIGNHVWLGMNATVLKNSHVPSNSIVAWGSVFSGVGGGSIASMLESPLNVLKGILIGALKDQNLVT